MTFSMSVSRFLFAGHAADYPKIYIFSRTFFSASGSFNHSAESSDLLISVSCIFYLAFSFMHQTLTKAPQSLSLNFFISSSSTCVSFFPSSALVKFFL